MLGYSNTKKALLDHVKPKYKQDIKALTEALHEVGPVLGPTLLGTLRDLKLSYNDGKAVYINWSGVISLALSSKVPFAQAFQDLVLEEIIPSIFTYGSYSLNEQMMAQLSIRDQSEADLREELERKAEELRLKEEAEAKLKDDLIQSDRARRMAELRSITMERLNVAFKERNKTQVFYMVSCKVMAATNEFKIGGVDHKGLLVKRLAQYNVGCSNPDLQRHYIKLIEVANYHQLENRLKELLSPFRLKRDPNTENFQLHLNIMSPLVELVADHYNDEIDKLNEFVRALLETHTDEFLEPATFEPLDLDNLPSTLDLNITRREFGSTEPVKVNVKDLDDNDLKTILNIILDQLDHNDRFVRRNVVERKLIESNYIINSNKRRVWDIARDLIMQSDKIPKYY